MPTIVDELIVRLDLDPKDFDAKSKKSVEGWLRTKKSIQDGNKDIADSFNAATKSALALFGVLVGAKGLTQFAAQTTVADAALGRFSQNLGVAPQRVQAWEAAVQRLGGASSDADAALSSANKQLYDLRVNGQALPAAILRLGAEGGVRPNTNGTADDYVASIAAAAHNVAQHDRARAAALLEQGGLGGAFGNVLMNQGGAGLNSYLGSMPVVSQETIQRMTELQTQWTKLQQTAGQFAQTMWGDVEPSLKPFIGDMQTLADGLVKAEPTLNEFGKDAGKIAESLGGWRVAIEGLLALWAGGRLVAMFSGIRALLGLGGAAAGGGAISGGPLAWAAVALGVDAYNNTVKQAGAGEDARVRAFKAGAAGNGYVPGAVYDPQTGTWGGSAQGSHVAYLRQIAAANGLDPDKFVALAMGEGLNNGVGDDKSSFGDFQLHYGGVSAQFPNSGLGDAFTKQTGLDARDTGTWQAQASFAAKYIRTHGAGAWSAARKLGIADNMAGVPPWWSGTPGLGGMSASAQWGAFSGKGGSVTVNINALHVNTKASSLSGVGSDVGPALKRSMSAQPANYGPT